MKIDGELTAMCQIPDVCVWTGLQMRDIQGVADGLDVGSQHRVRWAEDSIYTTTH
nr:unnamed protein product [Callosobruchus chinensis]